MADIKADPTQQKPPEASVANPKLPEPRRRRIPFSQAVRRFESQAIDGYYQHIFLERNVPRAQDAGYEFVMKKEVELNSRQVGGATEGFKGTDLGDRVSWIGDLNSAEGRGPERCYLMKIRQEWRTEDVKELEAVALRPVQAIFQDEQIARPGIAGEPGQIGEKGAGVYVKQALFNRPARKAKIGRN
jgi:hypothetical protein